MNIHLIAVGSRMPTWVEAGYSEYAKRLPNNCALQLQQVHAVKRSKSQPLERAIALEGQALLDRVPTGAHIVSLAEHGTAWSTLDLAERLQAWMALGNDVALLVGGADGLAAECLQRAQDLWSLSALTLPHPLVRVVIAEAIYRAWSVLNHHPYHRG